MFKKIDNLFDNLIKYHGWIKAITFFSILIALFFLSFLIIYGIYISIINKTMEWFPIVMFTFTFFLSVIMTTFSLFTYRIVKEYDLSDPEVVARNVILEKQIIELKNEEKSSGEKNDNDLKNNKIKEWKEL